MQNHSVHIFIHKNLCKIIQTTYYSKSLIQYRLLNCKILMHCKILMYCKILMHCKIIFGRKNPVIQSYSCWAIQAEYFVLNHSFKTHLCNVTFQISFGEFAHAKLLCKIFFQNHNGKKIKLSCRVKASKVYLKSFSKSWFAQNQICQLNFANFSKLYGILKDIHVQDSEESICIYANVQNFASIFLLNHCKNMQYLNLNS